MKKTTKNCLIYCRVSTDKQAQQNESLGQQEKLCREIAQRRGFTVIGVYRETESGRKREERKRLMALYSFIKENVGLVQYIIFRDIDRVTRGGAHSYQTIKNFFTEHGVEMVDSYGMIQSSVNTLEHLGISFPWSSFSPSTVAENIKAETSSDEVRNILTRVIGAEIESVRAGYRVSVPNYGYKNSKILVGSKKKTILIPNEKEAKNIVKMFELRASGEHSDEEIAKIINAMGYRSRTQNVWDEAHENIIGQRGGVKLNPKQVQRFIQRPVYCGITIHRWTNYKPIKANFDGLVDYNTFNRANRGKVFIRENEKTGGVEVLYDYHPDRVFRALNVNNPEFPNRRVVSCSICKRPLSGSFSTGKLGTKYPYYHCSKGHKYFGIARDTLDETLTNSLDSIKFEKNIIDKAMSSLKKIWLQKNDERNIMTSSANKEVQKLEKKRDLLIQNILKVSSEKIIRSFEAQIDELDKEIESVQIKLAEYNKNAEDFDLFKSFASQLLEHPRQLLLNEPNITKKQALFQLVFRGIPTYQDLEDGTPDFSPIIAKVESCKSGDTQCVIRVGFEPTTVSLKGYCSTS